MIVEDAVVRLVLPLAYGVAVVATVLLLAHVARRYASSPKRIPAGIGLDGRAFGDVPKLWLWFAPAIITAVVAILGVVLFWVQRPEAYKIPVLTMTMLVIAEVAGLVVWNTDRQIELARKQTFRIAPARMLRTVLPLFATIAALVAFAIRMSV